MKTLKAVSSGLISLLPRPLLAVAAVVLAAIVVASPALAGKPPGAAKSSVTYQLTPPATDPPEPNASGKYILEWADAEPMVAVTVSCRDLTNQAPYCVVVPITSGSHEYYSFFADARGRANVKFFVAHSAIQIEKLWIENAGREIVLEVQE
jgi:hypothetical protein